MDNEMYHYSPKTITTDICSDTTKSTLQLKQENPQKFLPLVDFLKVTQYTYLI